MVIELVARKLIEYYLSNFSGIDSITDQADPNCIYIGIARSGSTTDLEAWIIYRIKQNGNFVYTRMANKSADFSKVFDSRASYSYVEI